MAPHDDPAPTGAPSEGRAVRDVFSADETFQRLATTAEEEFGRGMRPLFFSGLGAGLALGAVFLGRAAVAAGLHSHETPWSNVLYPVGFLIVILGRYQLYTENTLTPVTLVLTRLASVPALLRLWAIVLAGNLAGAAAIAAVLAIEGVLEAPIRDMGRELAHHALHVPAGALFLRAVLAGSLVGAVVWLTHAVREATARVLLVYGIFLIIPTADLFHVITGFVEVTFGVLLGEGTWAQAGTFLLAVGLGNTLGGIVLVALLNFAQTTRRVPGEEHRRRLRVAQWLLGVGTSRTWGEMAPGCAEREGSGRRARAGVSAATIGKTSSGASEDLHGLEPAPAEMGYEVGRRPLR